MRRLLSLSALVGCLCLATPSWTQDSPEEKVRVLCDETDPENHCPGPDCRCVPDTIEITFDGDSQSVLEYDDFTEGTVVDIVLVTDTQTPGVQGWSFGVAHDKDALSLTYTSMLGTDANVLIDFAIDPPLCTSPWEFQTCGDDRECAEENRTEGGGWACAIVLSFTKPVSLPLKRNTFAVARYDLLKDVGEEGTLIRWSDRIAREGLPPTDLNVTVEGRSRLWSTATDGWIKKRAATSASFIRGNANADQDVDISDPIFTLMYLFLPDTEPPPCLKAADADGDGDIDITDAIYGLDFQWFGGQPIPEPYPACGSDPTDDELSCESFPVCE